MFRLIKSIIWIGIISVGIFFWNYGGYKNTPIDFNSGVYKVVDGDSFSKVLQKETDSTYFAKLYLKNNPPSYPLQKGSYAVTSGQSVREFIQALKTPINQDDTVTLLEGWTIYDIDDYLSGKGLISAGDFQGKINDLLASYKSDYPFLESAATLEGFLYPDTYNINPNTFTVEKLTKQMLDNFLIKVYQKLMVNMDGETMVDLVNLASIVERETRNGSTDEKEIVAGILKKRLDENWMIGADATVCYPYKVTYKECTPNFVVSKIYDKNQYNTRTMLGLPKTPIANPSFETINATLYNKQSSYYYYLHDDNGGIHYAVDNAGHEANKRKYLY